MIVNNLDTLIEILNVSIGFDESLIQSALAKSQGFSTPDEYRIALPFLLDSGSEAVTLLASELNRSRSINSTRFNVSDCKRKLENAVRLASPFPMIAQPGFKLYLRIDWSDGNVSIPFQIHESDRGSSSWREFYRKCQNFELPDAVADSTFSQIKKMLEPLIEMVKLGYVDHGPEVKSEFTEDAESAIDEIQYVLSPDGPIFMSAPEKAVNIYDYFSEDFVDPEFVRENAMTQVEFNGGGSISHEDTDLDLRRMVTEEVLLSSLLVNAVDLYDYYRELRDACRANFIMNSGS